MAARDVVVDRAASGGTRSNLDFAVVVGVEHYSDIQSVRGAHNDAKNFHTWLCDKDGGGLKPKNADLILSDCKAATPSQVDIDQKLTRVLKAAKALGGAHRLYFYFSGHGATDPQRSGDDVALLLTQWTRSLARLALSTQCYSSTLNGAGLFQEVAIFIDCCRNPFVRAVGLAPLITEDWDMRSCSTRKFIAFASEAGQPAFGFRKPHSWQGIFTRCLLSILRDTPGIRARELKDRLERKVAVEAGLLGLRQRAHAENGLDALSCFGRGGKLPVLTLRFVKRRGRVALKHGDLGLVEEFEATAALWTRPLPVGLYKIESGNHPSALVDHDGRETPHDV